MKRGTRSLLSLHALGMYSAFRWMEVEDEEKSHSDKESLELLRTIIMECVGQIKYGRLTSEIIDEFRLYKLHFITFVLNELRKVQSEADIYKRREMLINNLENRCKRMKWHMSIGVRRLIELIPFVKPYAGDIETGLTGLPGIKRILCGLHKPLRAKDMPFYALLRPR